MKSVIISFLLFVVAVVGCHKVTSEKTGSNYPVIEGTWSIDSPSHAHWLGQAPITPPKSTGSAFSGFRLASIDTVFDTVFVEHPVQQGLSIESAPLLRRKYSIKVDSVTYYFSGITMNFVDSSQYSYTLNNMGTPAVLSFPDWKDKTKRPPLLVVPGPEGFSGWSNENGILKVNMDFYSIKGSWDTTGFDKMNLAVTDTAQSVRNPADADAYPKGPRRTRVYQFVNIDGLINTLKKLGVN